MAIVMDHSAAYIVIICSFLIQVSIIGSDFFIYHTAPNFIRLYISISQAVAYLLYPLLGWLSDVYFSRYKVIRLAFIIFNVGMSIMTACTAVAVVSQLNRNTTLAVIALVTITLLICLVGLGLFEANAIQFGMDQMLEASSAQLSTFIHWYYWSLNLGKLIVMYMTLGVFLYYSKCSSTIHLSSAEALHDNITYGVFTISLLCMAAVQLTLGLIGLCLLICTKKHLHIERPGHNPLKLVYKVFKYAWNHTCPENRSAFTYWEDDIPPRIDLGKNKYGGPFTTEEVEDAKTFLRILLLLLPLLGFHLSGHGYTLSDQLMRRECPSFWVLMMVGDPLHLSTLTILLGIPMYQFLTRRYFQRYFPNMLKRMGLGLLCCLLKGIAEIIMQATQEMNKTQKCHKFHHHPSTFCYILVSEVMDSNGTCSTITALTHHEYHCTENDTTFLLLIIPHVLQGVAYLLVFMTALEFICAQAPLRLKGLLIGFWYASLAVHYLLEIADMYIIASNSWEIFHEVKAFLIAMCLFFYLYVSERYHYRVRDEVVNERFLVEEKYEREFRLAEEYAREKRAEMRALYGNPVRQPPQYGTTDEDEESSQSE